MDKNWGSSRGTKTSWGPSQIVCKHHSISQTGTWIQRAFASAVATDGFALKGNLLLRPIRVKTISYIYILSRLVVRWNAIIVDSAVETRSKSKGSGMWPLLYLALADHPLSAHRPPLTQDRTLPWRLLSSNALRLRRFCSPHFSTSNFPSPCYLQDHEKWADL